MEQERPPITALFLVVFDQKVGYTIAWKRAIPDLSLDGVEYKSLPSGLHGVQQDLVYFIHEQCAGISTFLQREADQRQRNANFVAVGVLVPLSYGRLGRSWLHAGELRSLATDLVKNTSDTRALDLYWQQHKQDDQKRAARRQSLTAGAKRKRAISDVTAGLRETDEAAIDHPALSMSDLLDIFGPLLFPLHRAALLRKRILLLGNPPVQRNCNYVYALSILSGIAPSLAEVLPPDAEPLFRLQPLFSVGVHDIGDLSEKKHRAGWLACTTDDILGEKQTVYDHLVELRPTEKGSRRRWPRLRTSDGQVLKATQRDLRRYHLLLGELRRLKHVRQHYRDHNENEDDDDGAEHPPLLRSSTVVATPTGTSDHLPDSGEIVEPMTWTAMAYDSFVWWASAGERDAWEREEADSDRQLLSELPDVNDAIPPFPLTNTKALDVYDSRMMATLLTAYFHRLTSLILSTLADVVEEADDETEEGIEEDAIEVGFDEMRHMGLDPWNPMDMEFVREAMKVWFGREASMGKDALRICGVRIC